jgi:hypothetical protein
MLLKLNYYIYNMKKTTKISSFFLFLIGFLIAFKGNVLLGQQNDSEANKMFVIAILIFSLTGLLIWRNSKAPKNLKQ